MKQCCKTGNEKSQSIVKIWGVRIVWGIVILLVITLGAIQIFNT